MTARNTGHFDGVDLEGLWSDSEYSRTHYEGPAPDDATLALVDIEDLPIAYLPGGALRVRARVVGEIAAG